MKPNKQKHDQIANRKLRFKPEIILVLSPTQLNHIVAGSGVKTCSSGDPLCTEP